jgi:hypothetical protein
MLTTHAEVTTASLRAAAVPGRDRSTRSRPFGVKIMRPNDVGTRPRHRSTSRWAVLDTRAYPGQDAIKHGRGRATSVMDDGDVLGATLDADRIRALPSSGSSKCQRPSAQPKA